MRSLPPDSLAPAWLPRQRRRHVDRALRKLIHRNACSICGAPFKPNTGTASGFDVSGAVALAGECCIGKLTSIFGVGFDFPLPASMTSELADIRRRSGVDGELQVNLSDSPWKNDDRLWFEQNRQRTHRIRMPFPDELEQEMPEDPEAPDGMVLIILVQQVEPGKRQRAVFYLDADWLPTGDDEATAHALFEVAMEREPMPPDREALCILIEKYTLESKQ